MAKDLIESGRKNPIPHSLILQIHNDHSLSINLKLGSDQMLDISKLKTLMEEQGWTEVSLAHKLGVDYSHVYRVMRGQRRIGKKFYEGFFRLCKRHNLDISDYLTVDIPDEEKQT